jgi:hypothetical protein
MSVEAKMANLRLDRLPFEPTTMGLNCEMPITFRNVRLKTKSDKGFLDIQFPKNGIV